MNKEELLQELSSKINTGEISHEEILNKLNIPSYSSNQTEKNDGGKYSKFSITKMLYSLGAAIAVIGIIIFVYQIWEDITSPLRILITLGLGLIITALGSMLYKDDQNENIGMIFHLIGGLLIPGGAMVLLNELDLIKLTAWPFAITFGIISLFYFILNFGHKNAILTFFSIANTTAFIYLLVASLLDNSYYYISDDIYAYLTMSIGLGYLLLTHSFRNTWNSNLVGILCFLGITGVLGAGFSRVFDSELWQMFYFVLVFGGFSLAIFMKSRSILTMSTIFLIVHVSYITGEYFADSIGWPISLVALGFLFIGLGFASITISKKFITN